MSEEDLAAVEAIKKEVDAVVKNCCERCGAKTETLYDVAARNSCGEMVEFKLCWDCDHDVLNGGDIFEDVY